MKKLIASITLGLAVLGFAGASLAQAASAPELSASAAAKPTEPNNSATLARCSPSSVTSPCSRIGSATMSSTFQRGFRLAYGS